MHNPIECPNESMRDLLPEYVLGTLTSAEYSAVSAHLTGCEACADEVRLIRSVGAAYPVPAVDIAGIVAALPSVRARPPRQWRLAAAISFLVLGGISVATLRGVMRQSADSDVTITAVDTSQPTLASGAAPTIDPPTVTGARATETRGVRIEASGLSIGAAADLSDAQLQRLLSELETAEALPSTELVPSHHPMTAPDSPEDNF